MRNITFVFIALLFHAVHAQAEVVNPSNQPRLWVQPKLGFTSTGLGAGAEINLSYKFLILGASAHTSSTFCVFCTAEDRAQGNLLVGLTTGLAGAGSISILTGVSSFSGHKKGNYEEPGFLNWGDGYEQVGYRGNGIPVQFNLNLGRGPVGFGITAFADIHEENPTGGFFIGVPLGNFSS